MFKKNLIKIYEQFTLNFKVLFAIKACKCTESVAISYKCL